MALEDLVTQYGRRKRRVGANMWLGSDLQTGSEASANALKRELAQLKDAQISARAAARSDDAEASSKSYDDLQKARIAAYSRIASSANSAAVRDKAAARRSLIEAKQRAHGKVSHHAKGKWQELESNILTKGEYDVNNKNMHRALEEALLTISDDAEKGFVLDNWRAHYGLSDAEAQEILGKGDLGPSFRNQFAKVNKAYANEDEVRAEARRDVLRLEGELSLMPGVTYGGNMLKAMEAMEDPSLSEEEREAAYEEAVKYIPTETSLMEQTESEIQQGRTLSELVADAGENEEFQIAKKLYGFDDDRKFLNYLLRHGGGTPEEPVIRPGLEYEASKQSDVAGMDALSTAEEVEAYAKEAVEEIAQLFEDGKDSEAWRRSEEVHNELKEKFDMLEVEAKNLDRDQGGVAAGAPVGEAYDKISAVYESLKEPLERFEQLRVFSKNKVMDAKKSATKDAFDVEEEESSVMDRVYEKHLGDVDAGTETRTWEEISKEGETFTPPEYVPGAAAKYREGWAENIERELPLLDAQEPERVREPASKVLPPGKRKYPDLQQLQDNALTASAKKAPAVASAKRRKVLEGLPRPAWAKALDANKHAKEGAIIRKDADLPVV